MYIYAYMYIFSFFETELDWIVCGDCGMWHSRELKKKEKYKNKKQGIKRMEENQRGLSRHAMQSIFFLSGQTP